MSRLHRALLGAAAAVAATLPTAPAHALNIVFTDTSGGGAAIGTQARFGFDVARLYWQSVLKDDVTVRLDIGFAALDPGVIAQTGSTTVGLTVGQTYGLLGLDAKSQLDASAVANLRPLTPSAANGGELALTAVTNGFVDPMARVGYQHGTARLDDDGSVNNIVLDVNTSVVKSMGITSGVIDGVDLATTADGSITFSNELNYDFDPTDGVSDLSLDFIATAIHEMGHALGFVSGVDIYDLVSRDNGPLAAALEAGAFGPERNLEESFRIMSVLDLFRYGEHSGDYGAVRQLDWTTGGDKYFSIDGGQSELFGSANFSTGSFNGDGNQASHWVDNQYLPRNGGPCSIIGTTPIGIMDPTSGFCELGAVTGLDLAAFDAMGWDLGLNVLANPAYSFSTADAVNAFGSLAPVPEPATWAMMIAGFGLIGAAARRRVRTSITYA
jgi:hypothetical protein